VLNAGFWHLQPVPVCDILCLDEQFLHIYPKVLRFTQSVFGSYHGCDIVYHVGRMLMDMV
jgi:hypothetical protein